MTHANRVTRLGLLAFGVIILTATSWAQARPPIVEKLANTYGLQSYGQIEAIRYTFNAQFPGVTLSRTWTWEPKTGQVTYEGKDKDGKPVKATYLRSQLSSQPANVKDDIDPGFVNDNYWFLFPFHVSWDTNARSTDDGMQKMPMGKGSADKVVVKYPSAGGYTPGDTWTLYVGSDGRVEQLVNTTAGAPRSRVVFATWAGYKNGRSPSGFDWSIAAPPTADLPPFVLKCGRQTGGIEHLDGREINGGLTCRCAELPAQRSRKVAITLPGNHDGGARAAQFGQIAGGCHANLKHGPLSANDGTIMVGL